MIRVPIALACALLAGTACRTDNNPTGRWTYGISREAYAEGPFWFHLGEICHAEDLVIIPVFVAAPFVLDTVLLPITVPRDAMYP